MLGYQGDSTTNYLVLLRSGKVIQANNVVFKERHVHMSLQDWFANLKLPKHMASEGAIEAAGALTESGGKRKQPAEETYRRVRFRDTPGRDASGQDTTGQGGAFYPDLLDAPTEDPDRPLATGYSLRKTPSSMPESTPRHTLSPSPPPPTPTMGQDDPEPQCSSSESSSATGTATPRGSPEVDEEVRESITVVPLQAQRSHPNLRPRVGRRGQYQMLSTTAAPASESFKVMLCLVSAASTMASPFEPIEPKSLGQARKTADWFS